MIFLQMFLYTVCGLIALWLVIGLISIFRILIGHYTPPKYGESQMLKFSRCFIVVMVCWPIFVCDIFYKMITGKELNHIIYPILNLIEL